MKIEFERAPYELTDTPSGGERGSFICGREPNSEHAGFHFRRHLSGLTRLSVQRGEIGDVIVRNPSLEFKDSPVSHPLCSRYSSTHQLGNYPPASCLSQELDHLVPRIQGPRSARDERAERSEGRAVNGRHRQRLPRGGFISALSSSQILGVIREW